MSEPTKPTSAAMVKVRQSHADVVAALTKAKPALLQLLPPSLTPDRFVRIVSNSLARNPALLQCDHASIVRCAMQSAELHLEIGGVMGEAYMIPFWDRKKNKKIAQFIAGYKGLIKLAEESPAIAHVDATLVHADDIFKEYKGTDPKLVHEPTHRGTVVAAYAIAFRLAGPPQFVVMTREELNAVKEEAKKKVPANMQWLWKTSPWTLHEGEMFRKCPIRRLAKYIPRTERLEKAFEFEGERLTPPDRIDVQRGEAIKEKLRGDVKETPPEDEIVDAEFEDLIEDEGDGGA